MTDDESVATGVVVEAEADDGRKFIGTIDLTPTWRSLIPTFIAALQDGTPTGRTIARDELYRLADFADAHLAEQKDKLARGVKTRHYFAFREAGQTVHINSMGELPYDDESRDRQLEIVKRCADEKTASRYYGPIEVVECATTYDAQVVHTSKRARPARRKAADRGK